MMTLIKAMMNYDGGGELITEVEVVEDICILTGDF